MIIDRTRLLALFAVILLATSCAVVPKELPPPPTSNNTAVLALLDKAQTQSVSGQWDLAGANLERALRIEPRNPLLWHKLARVRFSQGQYQQAENMATKSNSLAASDGRLQTENWRLIGQARSRRGDLRGAQAAFERAEQGR